MMRTKGKVKQKQAEMDLEGENVPEASSPSVPVPQTLVSAAVALIM